METKSLVQTAVAVLVAVIVFTTLLVPTVTNAQNVVGDEVTFTNSSQIVMRDIQVGDVLTVERTADRDIWSLNGVEIMPLESGASITWDVMFICDGVQVNTFEHDNNKFGNFTDLTVDVPTPANMSSSLVWTITVWEDHVNCVAGGTERFNVPWTFGYVACNFEDGKYCAPVPGGSVIVSNISDIVLCGAYTSGLNDTAYYYRNGVLHIGNPAYTGNVNFDKNKHEGTTDVYDVVVSVDIGNESFTPYRVLVPYEVHGHKESTEGTIIGMIPIFVIVGLILSVIGIAITRRYDL